MFLLCVTECSRFSLIVRKHFHRLGHIPFQFYIAVLVFSALVRFYKSFLFIIKKFCNISLKPSTCFARTTYISFFILYLLLVFLLYYSTSSTIFVLSIWPSIYETDLKEHFNFLFHYQQHYNSYQILFSVCNHN